MRGNPRDQRNRPLKAIWMGWASGELHSGRREMHSGSTGHQIGGAKCRGTVLVEPVSHQWQAESSALQISVEVLPPRSGGARLSPASGVVSDQQKPPAPSSGMSELWQGSCPGKSNCLSNHAPPPDSLQHQQSDHWLCRSHQKPAVEPTSALGKMLQEQHHLHGVVQR